MRAGIIDTEFSNFVPNFFSTSVPVAERLPKFAF